VSDAPVGLPAGFYARPVVEVARDLVGCLLVGDGAVGRIVETEAYHETEPASHGYGEPPRPTPRTRTLFGPPGHAYVYRSYGIHACVNAVCERDGVAAGVLLRAVEPWAGLERIAARRPGRARREWASGPGRLTLALGIELEHDGTDLRNGAIRILGRPVDAPEPRVVTGPRIGITRAVDLPWRFVDADSTDVSRPWPPAMRAARA
jgi:DNA-3-methyladenine glycosylase